MRQTTHRLGQPRLATLMSSTAAAPATSTKRAGLGAGDPSERLSIRSVQGLFVSLARFARRLLRALVSPARSLHRFASRASASAFRCAAFLARRPASRRPRLASCLFAFGRVVLRSAVDRAPLSCDAFLTRVWAARGWSCPFCDGLVDLGPVSCGPSSSRGWPARCRLRRLRRLGGLRLEVLGVTSTASRTIRG